MPNHPQFCFYCNAKHLCSSLNFLLNISPHSIFISCGFILILVDVKLNHKSDVSQITKTVLDSFRLLCTVTFYFKTWLDFLSGWIKRFVVIIFFFYLWMKMHNSSKLRYYKTLYIKDCKAGVPIRNMIKDAPSISLKNTWKWATQALAHFFHLRNISELVHWFLIQERLFHLC